MSTDVAPWKEAFGGLVTPGDVLASKYRVDRVLRGGGVGVVVQAQHLQLEERVAIKFLRPHMADNQEAVARFEREARSAFKIRSEHVARVIDVGRLEDRLPYIVMEYLDGEDLADVLAARARVSIGEAAEYGVQLCSALHAAHTLGIIHRDIKPENLFITPRADGTKCLKVLDFGLSKVLAVAHGAGDGRRQRALTMTGRALGTPQYMSPEQWMSASEADARADIWAAGVIVYELIAGVPPFQAKQPAALCRMILQDPAPPLSKQLPGVPAALDEAIMRCLRKKPEERYAQISELGAALRAFASSTAPVPSAAVPSDGRRAPASSHMRVFADDDAAAPDGSAGAGGSSAGPGSATLTSGASGATKPVPPRPARSTAVPSATASSAAVPSAAAPSTAVPSAAARAGSVASAAAPSTAVPSAAVPATAASSLATPSAATPSTTASAATPAPAGVGEPPAPEQRVSSLPAEPRGPSPSVPGTASRASLPGAAAAQPNPADQDPEEKATLVMDRDRANALRARVQDAALQERSTVVMTQPNVDELNKQRAAFEAAKSASERTYPPEAKITQPWVDTGTMLPAPQLQPERSRTWLAWLVAALLVLAAIIAAILLVRRIQPEQPSDATPMRTAPTVDAEPASPVDGTTEQEETSAKPEATGVSTTTAAVSAQPAVPSPTPRRHRPKPLPNDIFNTR